MSGTPCSLQLSLGAIGPSGAAILGRQLSSRDRGHQFVGPSHELFVMVALDAAES